jgi:hypothetical protein
MLCRTMTAVGTARPSAQGQEMTSTQTPKSRTNKNAPSLAYHAAGTHPAATPTPQPPHVSNAAATTAGTKRAET